MYVMKIVILHHDIIILAGKPLLMLRSIKRAKLLLEEQSKSDPRMHGCVVRFQKFVTDKMSTFGDAVQKVLMNETKNIFTTKTTRERNEEFMQKHSKEYQYVVEGKRKDFKDQSNFGLFLTEKYGKSS